MRAISLNVLILWLMLPSTMLGQDMSDSSRLTSVLEYCTDHLWSVANPIDLEKANRDIDIFLDIINILPLAGNSILGIKEVIPEFPSTDENDSWRYTYDLGYGLKSTAFGFFGGGYGTYNVSVIYYDDNVIKLRITMRHNEEFIKQYLLEHIKLPFECINGLISYDTTYEESLSRIPFNYNNMHFESRDTNLLRRQSINYFVDVLTGSEFNIPFYVEYYLGRKTKSYLRYFIETSDSRALESILFCPNPTGRLFAAAALTHMMENSRYSPTSIVAKRLDEVVSDSKILKSGKPSCLKGKFDYDYYDIVGDFERLILTE